MTYFTIKTRTRYHKKTPTKKVYRDVYEVESFIQKNKKPTNRIVRKIGKLYEPKKVISDNVSWLKLLDNDYYSNLNLLISSKLKNYGFNEHAELIFQHENILVNIKENKVTNEKNQDIAIKTEEGYISSVTLNELFNCRFNSNPKEALLKFTKSVNNIGLFKIEKEDIPMESQLDKLIGVMEKMLGESEKTIKKSFERSYDFIALKILLKQHPDFNNLKRKDEKMSKAEFIKKFSY